MVTAKEAAEMFGMDPSQMYTNIKRGVVTAQRYGRSVMVYPDQARQELEDSGFFLRREGYRRAKERRQANEKKTS